MTYTDAEIARVCHEAVRALQEIAGEESPSLPGDAGDAEAHAVTLAGIRAIRDGATPEELHATWARTRQAQGWAHGPRKDSRSKTHPALVPYEDLPEHQRAKDAVFIAIVLAMTGRDGTRAEVPDVLAELAKVQRGAQVLGMVVTRQARDLYAAWVDIARGDMAAVRERVLNAQPDCDDNEPGDQWNGTETGGQWFDRTREGK